MDFSSETLHAFAKAPHIGGVIFSSENERIINLLKMLKKELIKRKKAFADYGGSYATYIQTTEKKIPNLIIAINNYAAYKEMYGDQTEQVLSYLTREGVKYGITFILTAPSTNAVFFNIRQNFKQLISLQLNDESDYAGIVGKTDGLIPSKHKGRGLIKRDNLYEFQIAHITTDPVPFAYIRGECRRINQEWCGPIATRIPILPDTVDAAFLKDHIDPQKPFTIPIGVEQTSLKVHHYPFGNSYINTILSAVEHEWFFYELAQFIAGQHQTTVIVIDSTAKGTAGLEGTFTHVTAPADCEETVAELYYLLLHRHKAYKEATANRTALPKFPPILVMINSVSALKGILPDKPKEESGREESGREESGKEQNSGQNNPKNNLKEALAAFLQRGDTRYNITVILAEQEKNMAKSVSEAWYKEHVSGSGIWLGNGITEQYYMKLSKTTIDMREEIPHGFGYSLQNGKAVRVKLLCTNPEETEEE